MTTTTISDNLMLIDLLLTAIDQNRDDSGVDLFPIASIAAAVLHDLFAAGEASYTDDEIALIERAQDYLIEFTTHMAAKEKDND